MTNSITNTPGLLAIKKLEDAFAHFNKALFDGKLPVAVLTVQRKRGANGYFWHDQMRGRETEERWDEIAMNPDTFDRDDRAILSTLVHEMCHHEQQHFGTPPKKAYHNKEWASMMKAVGLIPSTDGTPNGKETGRKCTHYIEEGGRFDVACAELLKTGWKLDWMATPGIGGEKKKDKSKVKFTCPDCGQNAWAKETAKITCGDCDVAMNPAD